MVTATISLLSAMLIGFAAHRASLCNVRAVAELMGNGSSHMLRSLLQAVLWMATLSGVLALAFGVSLQPVGVRAPVTWALAGGWTFGFGAALNGGCSLSTLHRLADGELGMGATLLGVVLGLLSWPWLTAFGPSPTLTPVPSPWQRWPELAPWALLALLAWMAWQLRAMHRQARHPDGGGWLARLLAPSYSLAVGAALLGLAGGWLFALQGPWSYSGYVRDLLLHRHGLAQAPSGFHALLVAALVAGMVASAWQRGSLRWKHPGSAARWARHGAGGLFMGMGAALVPGGNDTLLLGALPALTSTAALAYASLLVGIASGLMLLRLARVPMAPFTCDATGCSESPTPTSSSRTAHPSPTRRRA